MSSALQTGKKKKKNASSFASMGLSLNVMKGVKNKGYKNPTPVQRKTIPMVLEGRDVVAMARTGSGKTAAFLLPILHKLQKHSEIYGARALILSPTRDLALQTLKFVKELGRYTGLRACLIVGGESMDAQFTDLSLNPDIVVATPGRLLHHIVEAQITFSRVEMLVFDEADRLFEMGFSEQIYEILKTVKQERQTLLFSATLPSMVYEFARAGLKDPKLVRLSKQLSLPPNLDISFFCITSEQRIAAFMYLMKFVIDPDVQTLVFCATRHHTQLLHLVCEHLLHVQSCIVYGSMDPYVRKLNVAKFTNSECRVMVVTDVAARGIDIPSLQCVINFNLPPSSKIFVHRIGRVGRGDSQQDATAHWPVYSLVSPMDMSHMCDIYRFLNRVPLNTLQSGPQKDLMYYGSIPPGMLDAEDVAYRKQCSRNAHLASQHRVTMNASKNFLQTRTAASKEAARMSKTLDVSLMHPVLLKMGERVGADAKEVERVSAVNAYLKNYRPKETILEVESIATDASRDAMAQKRSQHHFVAPQQQQQQQQQQEQRQQEPQQLHEQEEEHEEHEMYAGHFKGTYKDESFFLPMRPRGRSMQVQEDQLRVNNRVGGDLGDRNVIMDMLGDEVEHMVDTKRKGNAKVWDRKRKRYVGVNEANVRHGSGIRGTKKLIMEAGRKLSKREAEQQRGKVYGEWSKKQRKSIPKTGEVEQEDVGDAYRSRNKNRGKWGWKNANASNSKAAGAAHADRIKNAQQMQKLKKQREVQKFRNLPKAERKKLISQGEAPVGKRKKRARNPPMKGRNLIQAVRSGKKKIRRKR